MGGSSITPQRERLDPVFAGSGVGQKKGFPYGGVVDMLIATPGRFIEHLENTEVTNFNLRVAGVEVLVLDEVGRCTDVENQYLTQSLKAPLKAPGFNP